MRRLERDYHRAKNLIVRGAVGQEEYDRYEADYREAVAGLDVAKANRDLAALNVEYAKVIAPVSGRISRYVVTVGNLIQAGDQNAGTLLTTIVSVDPMYAYFKDADTVKQLKVRNADGDMVPLGAVVDVRESAGPVTMTSACFIHMVPPCFATGAGAENRRSLGTAVLWGAFGVTLFGIFLTPVFFYVVDWLTDRKSRRNAAPTATIREMPEWAARA